MMPSVFKRLAAAAVLLLSAPLCDAAAVAPLPSSSSSSSSPDLQDLAERAFSAFTFPSAGGGQCSGAQKTQIEAWMAEVAAVAENAATKLGQYSTNEHAAFTARVTLNVLPRMTGADTWVAAEPAVITELQRVFGLIRTLALGNFQQAGGFQDAFVFCRDDFQRPKLATDMAFEEDGSGVVRVENGQRETKRINQLAEYSGPLSQGKLPFWIPPLGNYIFANPGEFDPAQAGQPGARCRAALAFSSRLLLGAGTSNSRAKWLLNYCSPGPQGNDAFTYGNGDTLSQIPQTLGVAFEQLLPRSQVTMHEMAHGVQASSPHNGNNIQTCINIALGRVSGADINGVRISPQCLVSFAYAMWYLDNSGPDPLVVWFGGVSMRGSEANRRAGRGP